MKPLKFVLHDVRGWCIIHPDVENRTLCGNFIQGIRFGPRTDFKTTEGNPTAPPKEKMCKTCAAALYPEKEPDRPHVYALTEEERQLVHTALYKLRDTPYYRRPEAAAKIAVVMSQVTKPVPRPTPNVDTKFKCHCAACGEEAEISMSDVPEIGWAICPECGDDMELDD